MSGTEVFWYIFGMNFFLIGIAQATALGKTGVDLISMSIGSGAIMFVNLALFQTAFH